MRGYSVPVALTIAGSDSGGGAGIQADLKTFTALGVHGASVITAITAQNPRGVLDIQPSGERILRKQLEAVFTELPPRACKTGMLFSRKLTQIVAEHFRAGSPPPLVVDPVMVATSGAQLIDSRAIDTIKRVLLPLAAIVTPNVPEGEVLLARRIRSIEDLRTAARKIFEKYGCAVLMKGGHLRSRREVIDFFFDGKTELMLSAPLIKAGRLHGTGCTYAAAVTAHIARGENLPRAVELAKDYITQAIAMRGYVGPHPVLGLDKSFGFYTSQPLR